MAYFTSDQLASLGYVAGGNIENLIAAPDSRGMGFSITDILGGVGSAVGSIFGGSKSGNADSSQIAALIAQQNAQSQALAAQQNSASQKQLLVIGLAGLGALLLGVAYLSQNQGRRSNPGRKLRRLLRWPK